MNHYQGVYCRAGRDGAPELLPFPDGFPMTSFYWAVTPESLYWGPKFFTERYGLPLVITENGMSNNDWVALDGKVHDPQRIDFLTRYLRALGRAIADGADVRAYFIWTLIDNFEWAEGFRQRFGLIHVDYPTQRRTLKDSALWYRGVIASNGERVFAEPES
jgi:beta-glucosidase